MGLQIHQTAQGCICGCPLFNSYISSMRCMRLRQSDCPEVTQYWIAQWLRYLTDKPDDGNLIPHFASLIAAGLNDP